MQISLTSGALWALTLGFSIASSLAQPTPPSGEQADSLQALSLPSLPPLLIWTPDPTQAQSRCVLYEPAKQLHTADRTLAALLAGFGGNR